MIKSFIPLLLCVALSVQLSYAQTEKDPNKKNDSIPKNQPEGDIGTQMLNIDMLTDDSGLYADEQNKEAEVGTEKSFWKDYIFMPSRLGIGYEFTYNFTSPTEVIKNRFAVRLEYSKFLFNNLFVQLDTKSFTFLKGDSRSRDIAYYTNDELRETELAFGSITRNAFLQFSYKQSSIKVGIQTLAWGESDFAAVTDEINPFDFRDPLNLNIDELRLGQFMVAFNLYTSIGNWNAFFVPDARFNELPKEGTRFYENPFEGLNVTVQEEKQGGNDFEYGLRWKKTFGKSDVSIIITNLIDNNLAQRQADPTAILSSKVRFTTIGSSFNYAVGNLLIKGEAAIKFPKTYNTADLQLIERNAFDATVGFEYAPSSTMTLGLELVNNHIINWSDEIVGFPKNDYTAFVIVTKTLLKNNLSLNYISMFNGPNTTFFNLLSGAYKINDNITVSLDAIIPIAENEKSAFYQFRDQQHLAFKLQFMF